MNSSRDLTIEANHEASDKWQLIQDFEHWKQPGLTLRISYQHIPYSFGTTSYALLQQLSLTNGWNTLRSVEFKSGGEVIMPTEDAIRMLKDYADFLFADGLPAS